MLDDFTDSVAMLAICNYFALVVLKSATYNILPPKRSLSLFHWWLFWWQASPELLYNRVRLRVLRMDGIGRAKVPGELVTGLTASEMWSEGYTIPTN